MLCGVVLEAWCLSAAVMLCVLMNSHALSVCAKGYKRWAVIMRPAFLVYL